MAAATTGHLVLRARASGRTRRIEDSVTAMLRALARDLLAGTGPAAAVTEAARGRPATVVAVLPFAVGGGSLPVDVAPALADVRDRLRAGWELSVRHGIPLAAVVTAVADDAADRSRAAQERATQVAGPAVSGYVLAGLPVAGLVLGAGMGAHPLDVLTGSIAGGILLVVGTLLCCGGLLWADRIVRR